MEINASKKARAVTTSFKEIAVVREQLDFVQFKRLLESLNLGNENDFLSFQLAYLYAKDNVMMIESISGNGDLDYRYIVLQDNQKVADFKISSGPQYATLNGFYSHHKNEIPYLKRLTFKTNEIQGELKEVTAVIDKKTGLIMKENCNYLRSQLLTNQSSELHQLDVDYDEYGNPTGAFLYNSTPGRGAINLPPEGIEIALTQVTDELDSYLGNIKTTLGVDSGTIVPK